MSAMLLGHNAAISEKALRINIGMRLRAMATRLPGKRAVVVPHGKDREGRIAYTHLTFAQLDALSDAYARGFQRIGIRRGTRTLLMVKPSLDFYALTFGLFKAGAVPVLIDPGMGIRRLLHCVASAAPEALVGISLAQAMRVLRPRFFKTIKQTVTVGRRWFWGGPTLAMIRDEWPEPFAIEPTEPDELAAILFTTGSTGPAKGVEYEHSMFDAQCDLIGATYGIDENDMDLPTFPLFGLFSVALGMTAVIPDMDPTRPGSVNPERITEAIQDQGCTFSFGSPALWGRVSAWCVEKGVRLPTLRKILMAGAPIPPVVHERLLQSILPDGAETHTPYGATESLPATDMTGSEVLAETAELTRNGKGTCVGRPPLGNEIRIIGLTDDPIPAWSDDLVVPDGQVGEITVKGPTVTKRYFNRPEATTLSKIQDGLSIRHRMGDLGYIDPKGRLWFCGRKAHRVETEAGPLYTVCCEAIFNEHPSVCRSALVGIGDRPRQRPVIIIELNHPPTSTQDRENLTRELLALGAAHERTSSIKAVLYHPSFPVDIRHNAKIFREELTVWATGKLR